jgi:hypothetical protein
MQDTKTQRISDTSGSGVPATTHEETLLCEAKKEPSKGRIFSAS